MKVSDWENIISAFQPLDRVEADQQQLYVERPDAVSKVIIKQLRLHRKGKWIFCGSTGTGKSSELVHLAALAGEDYLVIALDLPASVNSPRLVQPFEVLVLIGAAAVRAADEVFGHKVPAVLVEAMVSAFRGVATGRAAEIDAAGLLRGVGLFAWGVATKDLPSAAEGFATAAGAIRRPSPPAARTALGGTTRTSLREGDPEVTALTNAVNGILDHLRSEFVRPPLVLVDGLDKVDDIDNIRRLFTETNLLAEVDAATVYAAPITLMVDTEWKSAGDRFRQMRLTNLLVVRPKWKPMTEALDARLSAGRAVARRVVEARLENLGFAPTDAIDGDALEELISGSGGLLRTLIRLMQGAIEEAYGRGSPRIELQDATAATAQLARELSASLNTRREDELKHVLNTGIPSGDRTSLELLIGSYVLPYDNGKLWWAPIPLVARLLIG